MSQFSVNYVDYIVDAFAVATICIAAELLLLTRRRHTTNHASYPHPDGYDQ